MLVASYRLSPQQQRLWAQSAGAPTAQSAGLALALRGPLDRAALARAWAAVISQHEILRTTFEVVSGAVLQQVHDAAIGPPLRERSAAPGDGIGDAVRPGAPGSAAGGASRQALQAAQLREALGADPGPAAPVAELIALGAEAHVLAIRLPALVADAASLGVIAAAVGERYAAELAGAGDPAPALQYADVAEVWHELLDAPEAEVGRRLWRDAAAALATSAAAALQGEPAAPRGPVARVVARVDEPLAASLAAIARGAGTTVPVVVLAAWQLLLARLTGAEVWTVAAAIDGRAAEGLGGAVGPCARYLPLPVGVPLGAPAGAPGSWAAWLGAVAAAWTEAVAWQDAADVAAPARLAHYARFAFSVVELPALPPAGPLALEVLAIDAASERSDAELVLERRGAELALVLRADPAALGRALPAVAPEVLLERLEALLAAAAAAPGRALAELPIVGPRERATLAGFRDAGGIGDWSCEAAVHALIAERARRHPDRLAVVAGDDRATYAELCARGAQLAHLLRGRGVEPGARVGICLDRSVSQLVAVVGVLMAGGAYVPLDPTAPRARLAFMLEDSGAACVVTSAALAELLPAAVPAVCLDGEAAALAALPAHPPAVAVAPTDPAYVLFTSGSTGKPKGAVIEHRSVVNLAHALDRAIYARLGDRRATGLRVSMNAPLGFDASVKQWAQLLCGHTLYVVPEEARPDAARLLALVAAVGLDVLDCTPPQLRLLLERGLGVERACSPALVLVGGEPIDAPTWAQLAASPHTEFFNMYGPTECTVNAAVCSARECAAPAVGRPLAGVTIEVVDERGEPAPIGALGELVIGGAGVARGYLGRAELTAERFFTTAAGRHYRTGDLGRYRADGRVEVAGRRDHQVKVRGYRIELGEIEATLRAAPEVREVAVIVRDDVPGAPQLVAYVVLSAAAPAVGALRDLLRAQLPAYMVPWAIVPLERMPLTPNAKVDRAALPRPADPAEGAAEPGTALAPPSSEVERSLAAIWEQLLGVDRVGRDRNFFDLGGHSLLLVRLHDAIAQRFGRKVPIVELFRHPTVAALARYLETTASGDPAGASAALAHVDDRAHRQRAARQRTAHRASNDRRK
jgi:amino acid adenylation domain-containing protein